MNAKPFLYSTFCGFLLKLRTRFSKAFWSQNHIIMGWKLEILTTNASSIFFSKPQKLFSYFKLHSRGRWSELVLHEGQFYQIRTRRLHFNRIKFEFTYNQVRENNFTLSKIWENVRFVTHTNEDTNHWYKNTLSYRYPQPSPPLF